MKVVLIYREPREAAFSIEMLFNSIGKELQKSVEIIEYKLGPRSHLLLDVWKLYQLKADIYHITGDVNYITFFLPSSKTVLTIHDIYHYVLNLKGFKRLVYKWLWLKLPLRHAGAITAISTETREVILEHFGSARNIKVIPNCYRDLFKPTSKPFEKTCPVILQVGTRPHKNAPRLVEALKGINCKLVLIGNVDQVLEEKINENNINYEAFQNLSDDELFAQFVASDIVAFVSLQEGFGMPIIEAQAVGRPVITSNISPMNHVADEAACLVDPKDISEIHNGLISIISSESYRKELVQKGFANVERFSVKTTSEKYLTLYYKLFEMDS